MQSLTRLTIFLGLGWALTLLYGELLTYTLIPFHSCSWPTSVDSDQVKVAVLADPQLMDRTSLDLDPKAFALGAVEFYTDIYMRRAFRMSVLPFRPDVVVFLGDQFDGAPALNDEEWQESLNRFNHIFGLNEERTESDISVHYLSGNHDIGYSGFHVQYPQVISRYEKEFGARNYNFSAGKVEFIVVDAQTLDGPAQDVQTSLSWEFIKNMSKVNASRPRVLLTHIPLYRADETPCGPDRASPVINQRTSYTEPAHGIRYQNFLSEETSTRLLEAIRPILVLSGHDHDQCTVTHSTPFGPVKEQTVGTVSWQQGNLYPSFMLLTVSSLSNSTSSRDLLSTRLCFLPMQTHIYIWYLVQFVTTLLLLIIWPTSGFGCCDRLSESMNSIKSFGRSLVAPTKEKDDEENGDYEMIWDAEGSMHLVKKATPQGPVAKSDLGSTVRGNATNRQNAKKNMVQEPESSVAVEINVAKVHRPSKSMAMKMIQRLIRVLQLLVVIAAVNVPLYMMLLFKDWIDR